jgi:hypothetical protein
MYIGEVMCVSACKNISSENTEEKSIAFGYVSIHKKLLGRALSCPVPENYKA